ncbi:MAG: hypothetical protein GF388_05825, partial [Candidatus Aegiribacteria sp.]|nr:hypothetical protein [Candidatus Aegiribacteria sp.]MBD3294702.1 hypothetical protein [Candidatus Fermentibacteria bacterium]
MTIFRTTPAAAIALFLACSWSGEQERILSTFNRYKAYAEEEEWDSLLTCLTDQSRAFVDSVSESLTFRGLYGYGSPSILLKTLCSEYIDFGDDVTVIFMQEGQSELTVTSAAPGSFLMELENDEWKLDLEPI